VEVAGAPVAADVTCAVVVVVCAEVALPIAMSATMTEPPMMHALALPGKCGARAASGFSTAGAAALASEAKSELAAMLANPTPQSRRNQRRLKYRARAV
jgi:negative regulator of sigma E activity